MNFYSHSIFLLLSVLFIACAKSPQTLQAIEVEKRTAASITRAADAAAQWQIKHMEDIGSYAQFNGGQTEEPRGWVQGTFFLGLATWAKETGNTTYFDFLRSTGEQQGWMLGERTYHADDHLVAQYYLYLYEREKNREIIAPLVSDFDQILSEPPTSSLDFEARGKYREDGYGHDCQKRWCWSDALFMSPPVWFHLSATTKDDRYAAYADAEYRAVTDYLLDDEHNLYFRDGRFFDRRENNGAKIFWSRGNGWVFAGLTNIIDALDKGDIRREWYVDLFRRMAKSLAAFQAINGYWPVSLAAGDLYPVAESSGTAFFVAGLAWGVDNGLLAAEEYMPAIDKGWQALINVQKDSGMLGYVQQIGYAPDDVSPNQTQFYGTGAFLLAATHVLRLTEGDLSSEK